MSVGDISRRQANTREISDIFHFTAIHFLPQRHSAMVLIYICHQKKIVIERTRDLIYLKFVATDFSPKIISPSAGENSGDLA